MRASVTVIVAVIHLLTGTGVALGAQASPPKIVVLEQDPLSVKAKHGSDTATTHLSLLNAGDSAADLTISLQAASSDAVEVESFSPTSAGPGATRVAVTLRGLAQVTTDAVEGHLVASGGAEPVVQAVTITPAPSRAWPAWIMWMTVIVFGVLTAVGVVAGALSKRLFKPAPGPKWSFSSWATNLTAAGGILGTVLGAATLPEVPKLIDKDTFVRLNLLFGALVVVGPFVYQAARNPFADAGDQEAGFTGWNLTLLLACAITGAAVAGELATLGLLGWELTGGGDRGETVKWAAIVLCLLAGYYFLVTVVHLVTTDWKEEADTAAAAAKHRRFTVVLAETTQQPPTEQTFELSLVEEDLADAVAVAGQNGDGDGDGGARAVAPAATRAAPPMRRSVAPHWKLP